MQYIELDTDALRADALATYRETLDKVFPRGENVTPATDLLPRIALALAGLNVALLAVAVWVLA